MEARGTAVEDAIQTAAALVKKAPRLEGVPTGVEGLDELFFTVGFEGGRPKAVPLGGFPRYAAVHVTGVSDTGKSLLAEQFALAQAARGEGVVFVTVESPAAFVSVGLQQRRLAMGLPEEALEGIALVDAALHDAVREDLPTFFATVAAAIERIGARHLVVDSLTGLYEAREIQARSVVRRVYQFVKKRQLTAVLTSQKRSGHEELSAEAAGGFAVSHILDVTLVLAKKLVLSSSQARLWRAPIGELVRFIRIDGSRLCGHDTRTHFLEITREGLLRVGPPIGGEA